ncbi:MAG TPA: hypothetical protein DIT04_07880, partial [Dysgonomonas sp.]|nr:hypothetical protein [Dysgonomonas sp.]
KTGENTVGCDRRTRIFIDVFSLLLHIYSYLCTFYGNKESYNFWNNKIVYVLFTKLFNEIKMR